MNYIITSDGLKINKLIPSELFKYLHKENQEPTPTMLKTFNKIIASKNICFLDKWFLKYKDEWQHTTGIKFDVESFHSMLALAKGFEHVLAIAEIGVFSGLTMCSFLPISKNEHDSLERKMFIDNFLKEE